MLAILQGAGTTNLTLDKSYFQHLQQLQVLEIHGFQHGNSILTLQNGALKGLQQLKYLNLQHVHLLGDPHIGNRPAPISEVHLRGSGIQVPYEFETEMNMIPETIQLVPVDQSEIDIVPYEVYKDEQERAGLSNFADLTNLVFLRVYHCNVKEVNWEMFNGLKNLRYLSLEGNKIPFLHEFSFYGAPNLKHLILSHNKLLNIQSTGLAGLLNLEILDLSHNNITHLTEFSFPPFPKLTIADLHHNPLELILPHTFYVMNNTEQLFIGGKSAELQIHPYSFLGLDKVHKMSMNNVFITVLEREYLKGMPQLKDLKMDGVIKELSYDAFAEVPKLQELILKHCSIERISMDAFFGLFELIYLDLSHNELESLPPSLLDQQSSLKEIILHHNKLTTLPQGLFLHTQAKLIRLDKNPWHCSCVMSEWQSSQINKIKVKIADDSLCQTRYDKGSMCKVHYKYQYRFEQSVGPRCATPNRFSGWSVFHMLRKNLGCDKYSHKHKKQPHKEKQPVKEQHHSTLYVSSKPINTSNTHIQIDFTTTSNTSTTEKIDKKTSTDSKSNENSQRNSQVFESTTRSNIIDEPNDVQTQENQLRPLKNIEINQNMWTNKDKQKFRLLQQKEETISRKINSKVMSDTASVDGVVLRKNPPTKVKKMSPTRMKFQTKMENTIRRLNKIQTEI